MVCNHALYQNALSTNCWPEPHTNNGEVVVLKMARAPEPWRQDKFQAATRCSKELPNDEPSPETSVPVGRLVRDKLWQRKFDNSSAA